MRGDRPYKPMFNVSKWAFTPHARGSTLPGRHLCVWNVVYPACAGIDRVESARTTALYRLPRMRGDRPPKGDWDSTEVQFTPHARGSTVFLLVPDD